VGDFQPNATIIADSISPLGSRLTTIEVTLHRYMLPELNTHRVFCLAGDMMLEFDLPAGQRKGEGRRVHRMRLDDFVDKWQGGARRFAARRKQPYDVSWIDPVREYTAREIAAKLGMAGQHNVNNACRAGDLVARKDGRTWIASGQAVLNWRAGTPTDTRYDIRARLRTMHIRQLDELTKQIVTSRVTNAVFTGEKEIFEVVLADGKRVAGSRDHRVFTAEGWKTIEQLDHDSLVYVRKYGTPIDERRDALRLKKIHGRWRSVWQRQIGRQLAAADSLCRWCRAQPGKDVHHLISVHIAPELAFEPTNVTLLCPPCHTTAHSAQGWQGGSHLYGMLVPVQSVYSRGIEPTYDLEIAGEFPNFLANGVVVHNSRNSASSRAIPFATMLRKLATQPAFPVSWPTEAKGMQGGPNLTDPDIVKARHIWLEALDNAVTAAEKLHQLGVHKSIVNRLLEPFLAHTVIVSATDWQGFWDQRCSPLAQPDIQAAADAMFHAHQASTPEPTQFGGWHLPYVTPAERTTLGDVAARQVSAARCARVSYLTHDGRRSPDADIALYWRLVNATPPHASPLEHVATPALNGTGNFTGWKQLRHLVLGAS
jgi:hypothetical protein